MTSENEELEEYNFQVQGVTTEKLARIINEAAGEDIRFKRFKVPRLTKSLKVFGRKEYKTTTSTLGDVYLFDGSAWEDYCEYKEIKKGKKRKYPLYSARDELTEFKGLYAQDLFSAVINMVIGIGIEIIILAAGYFLGLALTWIIANIITKGAYKQRKEIMYLVVEFKKEKDEHVKKAIEKIVRAIIAEGGYVKPVTKKTFVVKGDLGEYNNQFIEAYTKYFNLGNAILIVSFSFLGFLALLKFGGQFVFSAQQMVTVNYIFMIGYVIWLAVLLGVSFLIYGEARIRAIYNSVKSNEWLF
ncbi:MAG: hypothetical protein J7L47_06880 [Candidatus Odinarchaeota archaeon]|nr:hypothetical protein [Candidatus Odinarchaeota archaeon]